MTLHQPAGAVAILEGRSSLKLLMRPKQSQRQPWPLPSSAFMGLQRTPLRFATETG